LQLIIPDRWRRGRSRAKMDRMGSVSRGHRRFFCDGLLYYRSVLVGIIGIIVLDVVVFLVSFGPLRWDAGHRDGAGRL
jgi:hypothetical protein